FQCVFSVVRFRSRTPIQASTTLHVAQPWFSSYLLHCSRDDMNPYVLEFGMEIRLLMPCDSRGILSLAHLMPCTYDDLGL
ncbi:hypothetical protein L9F63_003326, partial [Diploptera punctata]